MEKAVGITMTEEEKASIERERREVAMYWPVCLNRRNRAVPVARQNQSFRGTGIGRARRRTV